MNTLSGLSQRSHHWPLWLPRSYCSAWVSPYLHQIPCKNPTFSQTDFSYLLKYFLWNIDGMSLTLVLWSHLIASSYGVMLILNSNRLQVTCEIRENKNQKPQTTRFLLPCESEGDASEYKLHVPQRRWGPRNGGLPLVVLIYIAAINSITITTYSMFELNQIVQYLTKQWTMNLSRNPVSHNTPKPRSHHTAYPTSSGSVALLVPQSKLKWKRQFDCIHNCNRLPSGSGQWTLKGLRPHQTEMWLGAVVVS